MPTTPRGYRSPATSSSPNVPQDIQNLATDVDTDVSNLQQARQVLRTIALTVPDSTFQQITTYDGGSSYNVGALTYGAGLITIATAGFYEWGLTVTWPATATTSHNRQQLVWVNGAEPARQQGRSSWAYYGSAPTLTLTAGGKLPLNAGDTVQAVIYHTFGSSLSVNPQAFDLTRVA